MIRVSLFVFIAVISGCSSEKQHTENSPDSTVVAVVGGANITSDDLQVASLRSLKKEYSELTEEVQGRLLESVISTIAMSQQAQLHAQPSEKEFIETSVEAYQDELWVREYLKEYAVPQPVTNQQIEKYYSSHPENFGGGEIVEYIHARCLYSDALKAKNCTQLLAENDTTLWLKYATEYSEITVANVTLNTLIEKDEISPILRSVKEQNFSGFKNTTTQLHRFFVVKKRRLPPKPLVLVQKEIRERLAPLQLKKAIKEASKRARNSVEILQIK